MPDIVPVITGHADHLLNKTRAIPVERTALAVIGSWI
jgi:hypothetical protein